MVTVGHANLIYLPQILTFKTDKAVLFLQEDLGQRSNKSLRIFDMKT